MGKVNNFLGEYFLFRTMPGNPCSLSAIFWPRRPAPRMRRVPRR